MGLYVGNVKPSYLSRSVFRDIYFKTSTEDENDYDSFTPFPSMKSRIENNLHGIFKSIDSGSSFADNYETILDGLGDFDIRKKFQSSDHSNIGFYSYSRLEDVSVEDIEKFVDRVTLSITRRKENKCMVPTKNDIQLPLKDDETGACLVEAELTVLTEDTEIETDMDKSEAEAKIPYLVKSLHDGSRLHGLNMLSIFVFMKDLMGNNNPAKWSELIGSPRKHLLDYRYGNRHKLCMYLTDNVGNSCAIFDQNTWDRNKDIQEVFWGVIGLFDSSIGYYDSSLGWDPDKDPHNLNQYFKMGVELISCCDSMGIIFGGDDIESCYVPEFVNSLAVHYVQDNRDSIDRILSKLYNSTDEHMSISSDELDKFNIFKKRISVLSSYSKPSKNVGVQNDYYGNEDTNEADWASSIVVSRYEEIVGHDQFIGTCRFESDYSDLINALKERAELLRQQDKRLYDDYYEFLTMVSDVSPRISNDIVYGRSGLPLFIRIPDIVSIFIDRLKKAHKHSASNIRLIEESKSIFLTSNGKAVLCTKFFDRPYFASIEDLIKDINNLQLRDWTVTK